MKTSRFAWVFLCTVLALPFAAGQTQAQKYGGILRQLSSSSPPSLSINEEATVYTVLPVMAMYSNLVLFDPLVAKESMESLIPELATSWFWSNGNRDLTFKLRSGVTWHDGKPFTSKDIKYTYDALRGAVRVGMKLNPRKTWYQNVRDITTNGDHEVTFKLKQPQPALLVLLASGYSPVYAAHVPIQELRTTAIGTGPFKLKGYERDKSVEVVKNHDYFVRNRPYLDGIKFIIIRARASMIAALIANQGDMSNPYYITRPLRGQVVEKVPTMVFQLNSDNVSTDLIVNAKKPPFNNPQLRKVLALALDRQALVDSLYQGRGAAGGGAMLAQPYGVWGLPEGMARQVPGMGDGAANKEEARRIMRGLGYGPEKKLDVIVSTRNLVTYTDAAAWMVSQLKDVYMDATLEIIESGNWHPKVARRDYQVGMNRTGKGADDPDINFFENYTCGSQRNYSDYCNPELEKKFAEQSAETDHQKRLDLVHQIDLQLQIDGARPTLVHTVNETALWPYVKNFVVHQVLYNNYRFQEVWLDK
ncbi:MAG: ABC transporter substrate-binding protein [Candidatus Lambdaproteobacteria bacterium]|nr:ABC transporter substrate-binding protein [Candidatus Lambdaproteobacteria bacterium]